MEPLLLFCQLLLQMLAAYLCLLGLSLSRSLQSAMLVDAFRFCKSNSVVQTLPLHTDHAFKKKLLYPEC